VTPTGQLELQELKLAAGQEWIDKSEAWRIVLLRKGAAYWLGTANPRAITEGEVLVITPNANAVVRASQLGEALLGWFPFDPKIVCGLFTMAERRWFEQAADRATDAVQYLPSTHPVARALTALLERAAAEPEVIKRAEALVIVLRLLAQNMPIEEPTASRPAAAHDRFYQIIAHMPDTELIRRSSEELAGLCGCTPRHFNRLFRAQFGQSPRARQTELRLLKARGLLESSEQPVAQIATECGYRSLSLFNSLFKRRFGFSPTEWRQRNMPASSGLKIEN
jgi:AraC-like DNA-binding protein